MLSSTLPSCRKAAVQDRPNVILIMTDDQGYGDFGFTGNPVIQTPNMDALAKRSARMTNFYVSPVCAPTRACLMTGRYNYRTRAIDTYIGRAMMEPEEVTIAEILRDNGYNTGIFGKWHLGDNYPMRPQEQGFEEVLVIRGGGIGQPSDPPGGEGKYTDPILFHNGKQVQEEGFCTDIYFEQGLTWMEKVHQTGKNFFLYLPTNAPHSPFKDVPQELYQYYKKMDLGSDRFPQDTGHQLPKKIDTDKLARIYAMITNIDQNIGKLFNRLNQLGLTENTIVMFLVDNGPNGDRYVAGMRGRKTMVYEGGIRSPFFVQWRGRLKAGDASDRISAHIDVLPTILEACGVDLPAGLKIDGRSLLPLLERKKVSWPDRYLVIQSHRGNQPVRYHNFAIRNQRWKLLHASRFGKENFTGKPKFELYDMKNDPLEMTDIANQHPEIVRQMKNAYDAWFDDVSHTRPDNYAPPRIYLGTSYENPVVLTRQDWRHVKGRPWGKNSNGFWMLYAASSGDYEVRLLFRPTGSGGEATLEISDQRVKQSFTKDQTDLVFKPLQLKKGNLELKATLTIAGGTKGPWQVEVKKL